MKFHTTQKRIRENYSHILRIGYADLQHLLFFERPTAYNAGVYGWNFDLYEHLPGFNGCIVTGYRCIGKAPKNYELVREYDKKAEEALDLYPSKIKYDDCKKRCTELLNEFLQKVIF